MGEIGREDHRLPVNWAQQEQGKRGVAPGKMSAQSRREGDCSGCGERKHCHGGPRLGAHVPGRGVEQAPIDQPSQSLPVWPVLPEETAPRTAILKQRFKESPLVFAKYVHGIGLHKPHEPDEAQGERSDYDSRAYQSSAFTVSRQRFFTEGFGHGGNQSDSSGEDEVRHAASRSLRT